VEKSSSVLEKKRGDVGQEKRGPSRGQRMNSFGSRGGFGIFLRRGVASPSSGRPRREEGARKEKKKNRRQ